MGYSSASVIALVYEFTLLYKKIDSIQWHTGGDMTAFVSESTHLVLHLHAMKLHKNTSLPALRYFIFGFSISASQMRMTCVNWCNWWRNIGESWSQKPRTLSSLLWEEPRTSNWMVVWGMSFIPVLSRWSCVQDRACFFKLLPFLCFFFCSCDKRIKNRIYDFFCVK